MIDGSALRFKFIKFGIAELCLEDEINDNYGNNLTAVLSFVNCKESHSLSRYLHKQSGWACSYYFEIVCSVPLRTIA